MFAFPGVLADLVRVGPEVLGTMLAVLGFLRWRRHDPNWGLTMACFAASALCRETLLLVPAMLFMETFARRPRAVRDWLRWALVPLPWLAWVVILRIRVGAWPVGMDNGNLNFAPMQGLIEAVPGWSSWQWLSGVAVLTMALVALGTTRDRQLRFIVAGQLTLTAVLGWFVWQEWTGAGRLLLPLATFCLVALVEHFGTRHAVQPDELATPLLGTGATLPPSHRLEE